MLATIAYSLTLAAIGTTPAGPCDLLDRSAAGALLGAPVSKMEPSGPEPDEETGATRTICAYQAGQRMLIVVRLDFPNAGAAREATAAEMPALRTVNSNSHARAASRAAAPKRPTGVNAQIDQLLQKNWTQARALGLNPPNLSVDQFVRQTQATVGEPKPAVARVLTAVQALSGKDILITPNLAADEIIEKDELR